MGEESSLHLMQWVWTIRGTSAVAFNDIDFCMKPRAGRNISIVYNPYAELYHYESKSRGLEDIRKSGKI
ncbi:MAG: hypothetical protein ACLUTA_08760 [Blautia wexlerae]